VRGHTSNAFFIGYLILVILFGAVFALATGARAFLPVLAQGVIITVEITVMSAALGLIMAFATGLMRLYAPKPLRWVAAIYIEVFRGTSALVQLFWLYFVLPQFGIELSAMIVAVLGLGLHVGAYGAEIVRGAVSAVPKTQWEASVALNLAPMRTLWRIILPQALTAMIPTWGNLMIELLKLTSLVSLITLADLTFRAQQLNLATFRTPEIFTLVLVFYLALSLLLTIAIRWIAGRLDLRFGRSR
jgi:polar amino acid transport system permease protein